MPEHAWDCRCGRRSTPDAAFCQHCGAPRSHGVPVAAGPPLPDIELPRPQSWGLVTVLFCVLLAIVGYVLRPHETIDALIMVLAVFALVPWWAWVVFVIVSLLMRVARAVERIGR